MGSTIIRIYDMVNWKAAAIVFIVWSARKAASESLFMALSVRKAIFVVLSVRKAASKSLFMVLSVKM